ncbi:MAG: elongation factor P [Pseudomonadota bacterium]
MYETSDIRKNLKIKMDGEPYVVVDFQFYKPGKGQAFTRTRLKNMITGAVLEKNIRSGEKLEEADLVEQRLQFMYADDFYHFMNTETYDQIDLTPDQVGGAKDFLLENLKVEILFFNEKPIGITLPTFVEMEVTESEPGIKGDTATGGTKPVTLSTGARVHVPLFINQGDWLKIDTRTGEYVERIKK